MIEFLIFPDVFLKKSGRRRLLQIQSADDCQIFITILTILQKSVELKLNSATMNI